MSEFVAYYRVSTDKQGRSGLGLEAQERAVVAHADKAGGSIVASYSEVESSRRKHRPELARALAHCKRAKAVLLIAKLDRLARSVSVISNLLESRVEFVCCDMPEANKMMIHIMAAMAEWERDQISRRTKDALASAKARGTRLGSMGVVRAAENKAQADAFAASLSPVLDDIRAEGYTTIAAMTRELNRLQVPTAKEGRWHRATVRNMIHRIESL
jgi:DNA invertase Pin-like site-specific DNA recombinase